MLGVIVVAYKNFEGTVQYVRKELSKIEVPYALAVVNNVSSIKDSHKLATACNALVASDHIEVNSNKFIIQSTENLGYAKGNNLGYKFLKQHFDIDVLLFSNDDIEIKSPQLITILIEKLTSDPTIGMIGPRVVGCDGKDQSPHYKPISIYRQIGWNLFPFFRSKYRNKINMNKSAQAEGYCYWVSGSFFMISAQNFDLVRGFDTRTFLYYEEAILAERLLERGLRSYYYPYLSVIHYEGNSTSKSLSNIKKEKLIFESGCYYYQTYKNVPKILLFLWQISRYIHRKLCRQRKVQ